MSSVYLDTHTAVFLHAGEIELLGTEGKRLIDASDLSISPMVLLELNYLYERNRIRYDARAIYTALNSTFGVTLCGIPFSDVSHQALDLHWTLDVFDRIIVAQAQVNDNSALITRDRIMHRNYRRCVW